MRELPILLALILPVASGPATEPAAAPEAGACWPGKPGTDPERCPPNDPGYKNPWEFKSTIPAAVDRTKMHPQEVALGSIGMSLDAAWQHTLGRDDVVIAVLDSGIRFSYEDLRRKLYLNPGELPLPAGAESHDRNGDGVFDVDDYAGDPRVTDRNANGMLDAGDLILSFSDCVDDDGNGYPDDISGYDFFGGDYCGFRGGDNDAGDRTDFGHGTGIASTAAAETNNGIRDAGVCPRCRVLPVRIGDSFVVDANHFARGVVFAVKAGASVIAAAVGSYNNTPAARQAIDFAYEHGVAVIASAADEFSYHHNYPSVNDHALYVNAIRHNNVDDWREASTFWGVNPCTNFGARVWITVPAVSCSSGATSRLAGATGLIQSMGREAGLGTLHAEEIYQVLRATADDLDNSKPDWGGTRYPARAGFDQYYGYGRLNALRAVTEVAQGRVPPMVDLDGPRWFEIVSPVKTPVVPISGRIRIPRAERATYRLEYALGVEPREEDFKPVAKDTISADLAGPLGSLSFDRLPRPAGPPPRSADERDRYSVTLRLAVTDDRGLTGEARRSFFVLDDPGWKPHFPFDLGASGEASPAVVDLDADGRAEIVLPTADGYVRIFASGPGGLGELRIPLDHAPPLHPSGVGSEPVRETVIGGAAVGDLLGDGRLRIVVASREGKVYAFGASGERLAGFPVAVSPEQGRSSPERVVESGFLSRPVLANLDGKAGLEIVATSLDGNLYAWRNDGKPLPGFPVEVERAKIVSTPAVGDVDGDGAPDIVFGTNGLREDLGAAYAVRANGNAHPGGAFVPGWRPVEISGIRPDLLPTVGTGVQMDPVLADVDRDGDQEVVLYTVTGNSIVLVDHDREAGRARVVASYSMVPGGQSEFGGTTFLAGTGSPLVHDTDRDGEPELYAPLLPFRLLTLRSKPGVPLDAPPALGGWPLRGDPGEGPRGVSMIPDYPRRMEDLMLFTRPVAADVDGDGIEEVVMGSGGYLLHAFKKGGGEAAGFPKFTGGWIFSAPAVGDLDGDGKLDLVTVTREGYLFAWSL